MKIGILGAGAYAMAISNIISDNKHQITIWTDFVQEKEILEKTRQNPSKIPNFYLPKQIKITNDIKDVIIEKDVLILAVPTQFLESVCQKMQPFIKNNHIIIASKGIDEKKYILVHQIIKNNLSTNNVAILSGPTFAVDIPKKYPLGLSIATKSVETKELAKKIFENKYVNLDYTTDILGTELCGAIKNIYAIVMGILEGLNCNESTKAMFITQIIIEVKKIITVLGADDNTILSYAGIGDIFLTCNSKNSRNYYYGQMIGKKIEKEEIEDYLQQNTVEGIHTLNAISVILKDNFVKYKIIYTLYDVIKNEKKPEQILAIDFKY